MRDWGLLAKYTFRPMDLSWEPSSAPGSKVLKLRWACGCYVSSVKDAEVQKHGGVYIIFWWMRTFLGEASKICLMNYVWVYVGWMRQFVWEALQKSQQKMPCSSFWACKKSSWPQIWGKTPCLWIPKSFTPQFLALVGVALRLEYAILGFYHITLLHHPPLKKKGGRKGRALPSQLALG